MNLQYEHRLLFFSQGSNLEALQSLVISQQIKMSYKIQVGLH